MFGDVWCRRGVVHMRHGLLAHRKAGERPAWALASSAACQIPVLCPVDPTASLAVIPVGLSAATVCPRTPDFSRQALLGLAPVSFCRTFFAANPVS